MKRRFLLPVSALPLATSACGPESVIGTWEVTRILGDDFSITFPMTYYGSSMTATVEVESDYDVRLIYQTYSAPSGSYAGQTYTYSYSGSWLKRFKDAYRLSLDNDLVLNCTVGSFSSMECDDAATGDDWDLRRSF